MRRFLNRRTLVVASVILILVSISGVLALYVFLNSPEFNERIRTFIVERTAAYTGTKVSLKSIRWNLNDQRVVIEGLILRGTESASEPPLAQIESISAGVRLRALWRRRLDLFELNVVNPEFHLLVDSEGRTNLPGPTKREKVPETRFVLSIDSLRVTGGKGVINHRPISIDFAIANLVSDLKYRDDTQVLSAQVSYAGTVQRQGQPSIPYQLFGNFDFARGTLLAQRVKVDSGKSTVSLQGKIDKVLTPELVAKLDYTATIQTIFLKHFFPRNNFGGAGTAKGTLEFSSEKFSAAGDLASSRLEFDGWKTGTVKASYDYKYPNKELSVSRLTAAFLDGTTEGDFTVASLPGEPRMTLNLQYRDVDTAQLERVYPWDPKYKVYSRASGELKGWFESSLEQFEFEGSSSLNRYSADAPSTIVALPLDGKLTFVVKPGEAEIRSSDIRFGETSVHAEGRLQKSQADLTVGLVSSNLADLRFLYKDANGKGSFTGTVKGALPKPTLDGRLTLDGHGYRDWTIQHAEGLVTLDVETEMADLKNVKVKVGESEGTINGTARLDGSSVNLRIQADRVRAEEFKTITKEPVGGIFSGNVRLTSLNPINVEGDVKGSALVFRGQTLDTVQGYVTYNDPSIRIRNLTATRQGSQVDAETVEFNRSTGALNIKADIPSVTVAQMRELGIPDTLGGTLRAAHIEITGTRDRPQIKGTATVENLSFRNETFPQARLTLSTEWPYLNVTLSETRNIALSGRIDMSANNYPFKAVADFRDYSIERLVNLKQGMMSASGSVTLDGQLNGQSAITGKGVIRSIDAQVGDYPFHGMKPFSFSVDSTALKLEEAASFNGAYGTTINLKGSVGLSSSPALDLEVNGKLDLSEITVAKESLSVTGEVTLDGRVGGTSTNPTINGIARVSNGSLGQEGIYTTLTMLNGEVRINDNRVRFDNLKGFVGDGAVQIAGSALIRNGQMEELNVRINPDQVRLRPAGLRSSVTVTGSLRVSGTSTLPSLDGNLHVDSMAYRRDFETFFGLFRAGGLDSGGSALDRLRLAIHVTGNRNISVQNELTDIRSASVDLDIGGTWANPTLTGHVQASEGTLIFQGKRYEITRGNIDFVDPQKIDPVVDIQAETDLRDYHVILTITRKSNRGDPTTRVHADLTSDPPLSHLELVSLVAGGKTREELERSRTSGGTAASGNVSLPTSDQLFQGGAASILTDLLRSRVGSRFGLMGLDWIRVDPHFEGATSNPALRLTLSQQVSKDLSVTYSQDLATSQQRVIMIEYFLSKNLSVVASREETNETSALGLDVKLRRRF